MYKLAKIQEKEFTIVKELSDEEYKDIQKDFTIIDNFLRDYNRLNVVTRAYELFKNFITKYIMREIPYQELLENVNFYILNFLSSFNSFLDHWQTHVTRLYGKESMEYKKFKEATAIEFDHCFSYRFIYELRNYTLHCDMPISIVRGSIDENDSPFVEIIISKSRLRSTYKWRPKVGLESMPEEFDIRGHMESALNCLKRIQQVALNLSDINSLHESTLAISKLGADYEENTRLGIVEFPLNTSNTPTSIKLLKIHEAKKILEMLVES
ncbi:hypothetical protein IAE23_24945 [Bacillus sp. S35]|uniref:hypothetical protein n=1 Tax=Priestia aryabhattai TaxID=412384 RepID=UPI00190CA576|nr:hypothetical protein [Priestia aryabhattai]MBK0009723.1 hypothetical protein [Bacillus sp. S35]MCM3644467.1 hypothetical protein [Priestia aryabhattai]